MLFGTPICRTILVLRAMHRDRKGLGSILAGGPIVDDEVFSTVPSSNFDMCVIFTQD